MTILPFSKRQILTVLAIGIMVPTLYCCVAEPLWPSKVIRAYANSIVDHKDVYDKKDLPNIIGVSGFPTLNSDKCSIGDGWVIVDMGLGEEIIDLDGPDLRVYEIDYCYHPEWLAEPYEVLVSNNMKEWQSLGEGNGITDFDLAKANMSEARYVKIQGILRVPSKTPGPDIEAIEALHIKPIMITH